MLNAAVGFKVVGIGGLSGELEVVRALFNVFPAKAGCAFVLVLNPEAYKKGRHATLLSGNTGLDVIEATAGALVEPERIYVAPPGSYVTVEDGKIHLSDHPEDQGAQLAFNGLLHSLAREYGHRSVAIVLCGISLDDSSGIDAILNAGGRVVVPNPQVPEPGSTPRNADSPTARAEALSHLAVAEVVKNNPSVFFRDREVFDFIRDSVIPDVVSKKPQDETVRIWVAGCGTGEEAYSLAILFQEHLSSAGLGTGIQVFASDADAGALAVTRKGHYPRSAAECIPPDLLKTYFTHDEMGYGVAAQVRGSVVFAVHDVLHDPPFSKVDLIYCTNPLTDLGLDAQNRVLALFDAALREDGILVTGKSQVLEKIGARFKPVSAPAGVYRRMGYQEPYFSLNTKFGDIFKAPALLGRSGSTPPDTIADKVHRVLIDRHVPAAILINSKYEHIYSAGPVARFLRFSPGHASHDLFSVTPKSLHSRLRSAIHRTTHHRKTFVAHGTKLDIDGQVIEFAIHVEPFFDKEEEFLLICFIEEAESGRRASRSEGAEQAGSERIAELELELEEARAELHDTIDSLEFAAEEHRAVAVATRALNAEYQTINEELLTSKQELQTANEELTTLNSELQDALVRQRTLSLDLENVLNSIEVPTLLLDIALTIRFFTPATRSLLNIIPSDIGRPFWDLNILADDPDLQADALDVMASGRGLDKEFAARNGRWYIRRMKPYRVGAGSIEGVVITFIDMSVQKQIAEDREAAKKSAELATEAKSHFLATASHDLRQPLQTLKLLQGLLEKSVEGEQSRVFVKRMEETLTSMSGILNTVLDTGQIEAGMMQPKLESFSISDLLGRLREEFFYQARAKGLDLRIVDCELAVQTDPRLLEQIVRNLLSNALKYTASGKILVGCRRRGDKLRVEVWDTGIGIPEKQIGEIFKEYRQLDLSTRRREQGLGLGLSIVKRLSNLLGLGASVRSQPGKGSVFSIEIERAPTGRVLVSLPPSARQHDGYRNTNPARLLVIADEEEMRDLLTMGLKQLGYVVNAAASPAEVLATVESGDFKPDLILADHSLSAGAGGPATIENVRRILARQIPALVLTGDLSSKTLRTYARHKIPHLSKPVKLRDVVSSIEDLLMRFTGEGPTDEDSVVEAEDVADRLVEIIDDEEGVRDNIRDLFEAAGWSVATYISAEEYLAQHTPEQVSCLLIDAYLPGMSGLELLDLLKKRGHGSPVIIVTGHSDVHMAVEAMKKGAVDFIEKPFSFENIFYSARMALEQSRDTNERSEKREAAAAKLAGLTRRQRQILERIVRGEPNKIIAAEMRLSQRTVENHRASIMRRTGSGSLSALLRLVVATEE